LALGRLRLGLRPVTPDCPFCMDTLISIACPVCCETLQRSGNSYACQNGHNFDLSKEGYLSLLHGRTNYQQIGDDKAMIQARMRAHTLPVYLELAKAMAGYCPAIGIGQGVLDIGCGDGFFLDHINRAATTPCRGVGVDISKEALAKAAKAHPTLFFIRADAARNRMPFQDSSFGLVMSVFAPRPVDEIRRVLRRDGAWLIVTATQDHLKEIREFLPLAAIGPGKLDESTNNPFSILRSGIFEHESQVAHDDLVSIVEMSPSIYRLRREFGDKWAERMPQELRVTFSFSISLLGTRTH
jgi:23S rRNA (guanine745-N1)-methyltransferase